MTTAPDRQSAPEDGPGPALFAVRMRLGLVLSLFLLAGDGSRIAVTLIGPRPTSMVSPSTVTVPGKRPCTLS